MTGPNFPIHRPLDIRPLQISDLVDQVYDAVRDFVQRMPRDRELGIFFPSIAGPVHLQELVKHGSWFVEFRGVDSAGNPVRALQHVNQVNLVMLPVIPLDPDEPRRTIGFTSTG